MSAGSGEDAEHVSVPYRTHFIEGHDARADRLCVLLDGHAGPHAHFRDRRIVDEHIEPAKFAPNTLCRGDDGGLIRNVELDCAGVRPNLPGRSLAALEITRPDP
jgi:hypothetical protein